MSKNVKKTLVILVLAVFIAVATLSGLIFSGVLKKPVRVDNVKTLAFAKVVYDEPRFASYEALYSPDNCLQATTILSANSDVFYMTDVRFSYAWENTGTTGNIDDYFEYSFSDLSNNQLSLVFKIKNHLPSNIKFTAYSEMDPNVKAIVTIKDSKTLNFISTVNDDYAISAYFNHVVSGHYLMVNKLGEINTLASASIRFKGSSFFNDDLGMVLPSVSDFTFQGANGNVLCSYSYTQSASVRKSLSWEMPFSLYLNYFSSQSNGELNISVLSDKVFFTRVHKPHVFNEAFANFLRNHLSDITNFHNKTYNSSGQLTGDSTDISFLNTYNFTNNGVAKINFNECETIYGFGKSYRYSSQGFYMSFKERVMTRSLNVSDTEINF